MKELFINDFKVIFPELFLIIATIVLLIYGVIYSTKRSENGTKPAILIRNTTWLGLITIIITGLLIINNPIKNTIFFYNCLVIDELSTLLKILVLVSTAVSIIISLEYFKQEKINSFEIIILILLSCSSMLLMLSSYDFISMYLTIELQSLSFYVLAASKRDSEFSTEAGLKYFILGAFSSGILLFGCSMVYGFTGITNFEELAKIFCNIECLQSDLPVVKLGILFLAVGFLFKLTAVPFHMWAPDVYEGAPTFITAFFAITPKIAILGLFLKLFLFSFYDFLFPWQQIILICSVSSMILASLAALSQRKIKRLLAYSSIGHMGYILMGVSCGSLEGIQAVIIYLVVYVIMTMNVFASVLSLRSNKAVFITDLRLLSKTNPMLAINLTLVLFSMAGIPPLAGFCSKFYLFFTALGSSLYITALIGVLTSVISCFYYIRLVKIMYFENDARVSPCVGRLAYEPMDREKSLIIAITFFFVLFFFIYPYPLFLVSHKVALSFML